MKRTKALGMFVGVSLPSLFMLLVSFDAPLVTGTDVFLISFLQVVFVGAFIGYAYRQAS
ncbi:MULTISPECIES: hypothetical protein [Natrinema]|uniref:Uncharacterized protein n=1 Tax=Natrinema longum TaxID=370324 RepID=A0A8A2U5A6_9EURY|nr:MULTISPECIES: hypothetical protein [Natrinema]MBZ6494812.1 hypothetical protein [Natrinema longum]QSW83883.1 hypothetical protein J0X27_10405 [Natrinema longum]